MRHQSARFASSSRSGAVIDAALTLRSVSAYAASRYACRLPLATGAPQPTPPVTYEVQINGESFPVEANRAVKVDSQEKPGVGYNVAVRVAPTQQVRLEHAPIRLRAARQGGR